MADKRVLLEGDTLHIGFHGTGKAPYPEDIVPGGVLRALAQYLKVNLETEGIFWGDYCYFAGVTGEAFRFLEFMELGRPVPGQSLVERYGLMSIAQMYQHALDAAGLEGDVFIKPALPDAESLRRQIVQSIGERKTPVVGTGVFGPPEPFLITGYDEEGAVLLGWSHFQGERKDDADLSFEPTGQFRLRNWYGKLDGVVIVSGTKPRASLREVYRAALVRGLRELQVVGSSERPLGAAAMEKWAKHLESEGDFAGMTQEQWSKAHQEHGGTAGDLAERRALADSFTGGLACRWLPEAADDLRGAAAAFKGSHDTVYEIWEQVAKTGPFDPDLNKFMDPNRRKVLAELVRRLAVLDRRAVAYLKRALAIVDGQPAGAAVAPDALLDGTVRLSKAAAQPAGHGQSVIWAPENIAMPNAMGMLRAFSGQSFGDLNETERANQTLDYAMWMGLTGAAFGTNWDGPERANLPLAFDALGYDYELWMSGKLAKETGLACRVWGWDDNLRRRIYWNLRDRRLPVLLFGCGQWPDWWLVTTAENWGDLRGYGGQNGEGYRPNEPLDHPKNPLRRIELFEGMKGKQTWTINITARRSTPKPAMEELYQRAIAWGAQKMRELKLPLWNAKGQEFVSERPYQDWATMMRTDALFPADQPDVLKQRRKWLEGHEVELAERRFYGASFLEMAATRLTRPALREAAGHFRAVNKLMEQIWSHLGGMEAPEGHLRYGERGARATIAELLLQIEREDAAAAAFLSR